MHRHKKKLGQHFLHDKNLINKLVRYISPNSNDYMLEIGPGQGILSQIISRHVKRLILIEKDRDLIKSLERLFCESKNVQIFNDDILKINLNSLVTKNTRVVGNLPYNISTEILFKLIDTSNNIKDMHFMLQKEVVDRIVAKPNSKVYGRLSVMIQVYYKASKLFEIPPDVFVPKPRVYSTYIKLEPKRKIFDNVDHEENFKKIVNAAFVTRRKMLKTSLKNYMSNSVFDDLNIKPEDRAENLTPEMFRSLARNV